MRFLALTSWLLLGAGCVQTSSPSSSSPPSRPQVAIDLAAQTGKPGNTFGLVDLYVHDGVVTAELNADPAVAWSHLADVYGELGIRSEELDVYEPGMRRLGVMDHRTRQLAGKRLSTFLRCGDSLGAAKADNGQVRLSVTTWVEPHEGGSSVRTTVSAWTRGVGTSTGAIRCTSQGVLERKIVEHLQVALAQGGR